MDFRVCWIVELLRNPSVGCLGSECLDAGDGTLHPFGGGREFQRRAEQRKKGAPFQTHALRHGKDEFVAFGCSHKSQRNAGIAGGRFNDRGVRCELPGFFRIRDHGGSNAVFDAAKRIGKFAF